MLENNIKIEEDKQKEITKEVMTLPILKILYEFWIIDSYDKNQVNLNSIFKDNRALVSIKNDISDLPEETSEKDKIIEVEEDKISIPNLNLPGINEDMFIDIDGKNYVNNNE